MEEDPGRRSALETAARCIAVLLAVAALIYAGLIVVGIMTGLFLRGELSRVFQR